MAAAPRAVWKGFLSLGAVSCAIKLIGATSESEKIHFRTLSRKSKQPVKAAYIDEETEDSVAGEDQVKGYQLDSGAFLTVESDELKQLKPTSEHTLEIDGAVALEDIDQRYLEKPYYVIPGDAGAVEPFAVIREALRKNEAATRSCIVLYQRGREVLLQAQGKGMVMTTLRNHNEVLSADSVVGKDKKKEAKSDPEVVEIAGLLIDKKKTSFDPSKFEDRYENALIEMIEAKRAGKKPPKPVAAPKENVVDLVAILRKSLAESGGDAPAKGKKAPAAAKRKATKKAA